MEIRLSVLIRKENPIYMGWCPELDIASQGETVEEAKANVKEAIELYLEDEDAYIPEEIIEHPEENPFLTCVDLEI